MKTNQSPVGHWLMVGLMLIVGQVYGQQTGEIPIVKKEFKTKVDLQKLELNQIGKVVISYGQSTKIEVEGSQEEVDKIKFSAHGKTASIGASSTKGSNNTTLYLTLTDPQALKVDANAVGRIESSGSLPIKEISVSAVAVGSVALDLDSDKFTLAGKALGSAQITGRVANYSAQIEAIGTLDCGNLAADGARLQVKASTDIFLNVAKYLELDLAACPKVSLKGNPEMMLVKKDPQVTIERIN